MTLHTRKVGEWGGGKGGGNRVKDLGSDEFGLDIGCTTRVGGGDGKLNSIGVGDGIAVGDRAEGGTYQHGAGEERGEFHLEKECRPKQSRGKEGKGRKERGEEMEGE